MPPPQALSQAIAGSTCGAGGIEPSPTEIRSLPAPIPGFTGGAAYRDRLFYTLTRDALVEVEAELLDIKSMRILARYPWAPGKRLRPLTFLLSFLAARVTGNPRVVVGPREVRLAAALELLHEASLVHDDLVDRSTVRRGRPTIQMESGAAMALIVGDYMVFRALKLVLDSARDRDDIVLAQQLADTGLAIAHGEVEQLDAYLAGGSPEERMSPEAYYGVTAKKTAAFFAGCAEGGAALAGAPELDRAALREFGMALGIAFQVVDDLMDVLGDPEKARKSLRSNLDEGTITLPMIVARRLEPGCVTLERLAAGRPLDASEQQELYRLLSSPEVVGGVRADLERHRSEAASALGRIAPSVYRLALADLLDYVCRCPWGGLEARLR